MNKSHDVVPVLTNESNLKRRLRKHLRVLGFKRNQAGDLVPPDLTKESIRTIHQAQRVEVLEKNARIIQTNIPKLRQYFASGADVDPAKIQPRLELIKADTWQSYLFRLATLTWSIPVSAGFGRRLRYLVWDQHNEKLIGVIALGDPVFNLKARDAYVGWDSDARQQRLVHVLDAYVLGAIAPYNMLLGGKLIACLGIARQ